MKQIKLSGKIQKNEFLPDSPRNFLNAMMIYEGKKVMVTIGIPTKQRSNPQNSYLWAVPYRMIADETGNDVDSIHHYMAGMFLSKKTSCPIDKVRSTTKLTTVEFSEYIEKIIRWSAEFLSMYIPLPEEEDLLKWIDDNAK